MQSTPDTSHAQGGHNESDNPIVPDVDNLSLANNNNNNDGAVAANIDSPNKEMYMDSETDVGVDVKTSSFDTSTDFSSDECHLEQLSPRISEDEQHSTEVQDTWYHRDIPETSKLLNRLSVTGDGEKLGNPAIESKTNLVKHFQFLIDLTCSTDLNEDVQIVDLSCKHIKDLDTQVISSTYSRDSDTSGHLGDSSRSTSLASGSFASIPPPASVNLNKLSITSSSSSGASVCGKVKDPPLVLHKTDNEVETLTESRVNYLMAKFKNIHKIFEILNYVDGLIGTNNATSIKTPDPVQGSLTTEHDDRNCRKRTQSKNDDSESVPPDNKRLRSCSPLPSTSNLDNFGVFAKWHNGKYYYGHIEGPEENECFKVRFVDARTRKVRRDQIIFDIFLMIGQKVMVSKNADSDLYIPGIVTECNLYKDKYKYTVVTDHGDMDVELGQIYFAEIQAKSVRDGVEIPDPPMEASVTEDYANLASSSFVWQGSSSHSYSSSDPENIKMSVKELTTYRKIGCCETETSHIQCLGNTIKLKGVPGKSSKSANKSDDLLLGPIVKSDLFCGMHFILTCSRSIGEDVLSDDYPFTTIPFVHDRLVQQIQSAGGRVHEFFEDISRPDYLDTYLVTNRPCLTPKYIKCLTSGITLINHEWVITCIRQQQIVPISELPSGWSIELSKFIELFERRNVSPLSNLKMQIASMDKVFLMFWLDICKKLGALVSEFRGDLSKVDVLIVETGYYDAKFEEATEMGIPILSAKWVIQSAIHGEMRPFDYPAYCEYFEDDT